MSRSSGRREWEKWKKGEKLTRGEAMLANCFICNGLDKDKVDCGGKRGCPIYPFRPDR